MAADNFDFRRTNDALAGLDAALAGLEQAVKIKRTESGKKDGKIKKLELAVREAAAGIDGIVRTLNKVAQQYGTSNDKH